MVKSKKLVQELLFAFNEISVSSNHKKDFDSIKLQRGMLHYEAPLNWAKLILEGNSPQAMKGSHSAYSLLFPMEAVFESYVAHYLKKHVAAPQRLSSQVQSEYLVDYGSRKYFRLKPDLVVTDDNSSTKIVLDTKWKLINGTAEASKDKFGLSQSDFYQMLAYGYNYLDGKGTLILIYPKTADFKMSLSETFYFDKDRELELKVVPFDVSFYQKGNTCERIDLSLIGFTNKQSKVEAIT